MKFYIKNINTNEVQELEGKEKWLEEKLNNVDSNDYLCDRYIKTLSQNMRSFYCAVSKNDFDLQRLNEEKQVKIAQCKHYLNSTDWYIIRLADSGDVIPDEVRIKRTQARDNIDLIEPCKNLDELNQINTDF